MRKTNVILLGLFLIVSFSNLTLAADFLFETRLDFPTANFPSSIISLDFNGDGYDDLATACDSTVSILMGNGDGTFQSHVNYYLGENAKPNTLIAADFNNDGDDDLATANSNTDDISILLGNGDGTFQTAVSYDLGEDTYSLVAIDLNGDNYDDLATPIRMLDSAAVLINNGDGTFQNPVNYAVGDWGIWPVHIASDDFDGDGDNDLAVVCSGRSTTDYRSDISILINNGNGTFQSAVYYDLGYTLNSSYIISYDFNGDDNADLATANTNYSQISVLLGNGDGTFQGDIKYPAGGGSTQLLPIDFDGDGYCDLGAKRESGVSILIGNGDGTFQSPVYNFIGDGLGGSPVVYFDINDDGNGDLLAACASGDYAGVLIGNGDGTFLPVQSYTVSYHPNYIIPCDVDGNGDYDLITANGSPAGSVSILFGNGDGTFTTSSQTNYPTGDVSNSIFSNDFNNDGYYDLAFTNEDTEDVSVLINNGDGTFQSAVSYPAGTQTMGIFSIDFNHDGNNDLVAGSNYTNSNYVSILLGNGDGTFQSAIQYSTYMDFWNGGRQPYDVFAADFNNDGDNDVAALCTFSHGVSILLGNGDGTFQSATSYISGNYPWDMLANDFDNDGYSDLIVVDHDAAQPVMILLNNGDGTFQDAVRFGGGISPDRIFSDDFDGDSNNDLAIAGYYYLYILLGNGDGTFQSAVTYNVHHLNSVISIDLNGDSYLDIAIACFNIHVVYTLLGNGDGSFQDPIGYGIDNSPYGLFSADFDGDGDNDLATANWYDDNASLLFNTIYLDSDNDGILDGNDNCPYTYNPLQTDGDGDLIGDACDNCPTVSNADQLDNDADDRGNACDNCPDVPNYDQVNSDEDTFGDACDNCPNMANEDQADGDSDTVGDLCDNCIATPNTDQANNDSDSLGNVCDNCPDVANDDQINSDSDSFGDACDNCPDIDNEDQADTDSDTVGDLCDNCVNTANTDQANGDSDSFGDICDNCPDVDNEDQADGDSDDVGDLCDNCIAMANADQANNDSDSLGNVCDNCPDDDNNDQADSDSDAIGDVCDNCAEIANEDQADTDADTYGDVCDNCPLHSNSDQLDGNGDGIGDACTFESETNSGVDVEVALTGSVNLTFDEVTGDGTSVLMMTITGPDPVSFGIVPSDPPVYYNITTDATYSGLIEICIGYDDTELTGEEEAGLTLQHHDGSNWVDITTSLDTENNIICGETSDLSPFVIGLKQFVCGDVNDDESINVSDAVYIINFVFVGGNAPDPLESADVNCDGSVNVSDAVYIINYVFVGGNHPCDTNGDTIPDC